MKASKFFLKIWGSKNLLDFSQPPKIFDFWGSGKT
jgi:hypothetical protein